MTTITTWWKRINRMRSTVVTICFVVLTVSRLPGDEPNPEIKELFQQASAAAKRNDLDAAITALTQAIKLEPNLAPAYYDRGLFYQIKGDYAKAIADFNQVIAINPTIEPPYNNLAWIYATNPNTSLRNGKKAVELATKACAMTHYGKREELESLAAACAELGDFDSAVRWQKVVTTMPGLDAETLENAKVRLAFYLAHHPYHEKK